MQATDKITREEVYSLSQRLTHWFIALAVCFELVSAWLIQHSNVDVVAWFDWHVMIGQVLLLALAYRVFLLLRPGSGHWRLLLPTREQRHVVLQTLKFYLSLGRLNCPAWYAFNPVWQPLYLLMILVMLLAALTGFFIGSYVFPLGFSMPQLHGFFSTLILGFIVLHTLFVFIHDARGQGAQISAMLNGFKYFHVKKSAQPDDQADVNPKNSVSLDSLLKK